jgi:hypothetical protein
MHSLQIFLWGVGGSVAIVIVHLYYHYERGLGIPSRYRKIGYWVVRTLVALLGGALAVAYDIDNPILAINIGASAPLLVTELGRGFLSSASAESNCVLSK